MAFLLCHISSPHFTSLCFWRSRELASDEDSGLVDCMHPVASHAHQLRTLTLEFTTSDVFPISSLAPLYKCRLLEDVCLRGIDLDDRAIEVITQAWPNLREFTLGERRPAQPMCTLYSLHHFAEHCPNLSTLRIAVNAVKVACDPPNDAAHPPSQLLELDVMHSPCGVQTDRIAKYLYDLFPTLKEFRSRHMEWADVKAQLDLMRAAALPQGGSSAMSI